MNTVVRAGNRPEADADLHRGPVQPPVRAPGRARARQVVVDVVTRHRRGSAALLPGAETDGTLRGRKGRVDLDLPRRRKKRRRKRREITRRLNRRTNRLLKKRRTERNKRQRRRRRSVLDNRAPERVVVHAQALQGLRRGPRDVDVTDAVHIRARVRRRAVVTRDVVDRARALAVGTGIVAVVDVVASVAVAAPATGVVVDAIVPARVTDIAVTLKARLSPTNTHLRVLRLQPLLLDQLRLPPRVV